MTSSPADGMRFPRIDTKTLAGSELSFPKITIGKKVLLLLVFENRGNYQEAQAQANQWISSWNKDPQTRQIALYEIPMMGRFYRISQSWIDQILRGPHNQAHHDSIACYYGSRKKYIRVLNIEQLDQAHLFLLNEQGLILHQVSGDFSKDKISALMDYL